MVADATLYLHSRSAPDLVAFGGRAIHQLIGWCWVLAGLTHSVRKVGLFKHIYLRENICIVSYGNYVTYGKLNLSVCVHFHNL